LASGIAFFRWSDSCLSFFVFICYIPSV